MALTIADSAHVGALALSPILTELSALQDAILNGQRPQYKLPAATIAKLRSSVNDLKRVAPQEDGQRKRQRIESILQEQGNRRKNERDERGILVDVDSILTKAHQLVPPVSGLKVAEDAKSSFDENDYYSSQVESKWSDDEAKPFTADFESLDTLTKKRATDAADIIESSDDEYIPDEPLAQKTTVATPDDEPSDYEPGEVTQVSDDYTPDYAMPTPSDNEPRLKVKNHLTQIAAPQPNRISPMAMHKSYELELVNGRPEMVKKKKYETDARQSSASPPLARNKRKSKKRKREVEQTPQLRQPKKRSNRDAGLDTSAQYPVGFKSEAKLAVPTYSTQPLRSTSVVQPSARREEQNLRRVATLHAQARPEYSPYSPSAPYAQPPIYRQPTVAPMPPPRPYIPAGGEIRYYPTEPLPQALPATDLRYERAPSRMSQYDPNNARIDYAQSVHPTAAVPAFQDPRMHNIRGSEYEPVQPMYAPRPYAAPEYAQPYPPRQESVAPPQYYHAAAPPEQLRAISAMPPGPPAYVDAQAYGAVREGFQVLQYPPAGLQPAQPTYGLPPDQHIRYIDSRGYEVPFHLRPVPEQRQY